MRVQMDERNRARLRAFPRGTLRFVRSGTRFFFLRGRRLAFFRLSGRRGLFFVFFEFVFFGIFQKAVELFVAHSRLTLILSKIAYCRAGALRGYSASAKLYPKEGEMARKADFFCRPFPRRYDAGIYARGVCRERIGL